MSKCTWCTRDTQETCPQCWGSGQRLTPNPMPNKDSEELRTKFKELKDLRNNRHMDEPEFDDRVIQLFDEYVAAQVAEAEKRGMEKGVIALSFVKWDMKEHKAIRESLPAALTTEQKEGNHE